MSEVQVDPVRELVITRRQLAAANQQAAQAEAVAGQLLDEVNALKVQLVEARKSLEALGAYPGDPPTTGD